MARTVAKPKPKTMTKLPPGSPPKKRPGRPPGSKNKVAAEPVRKLTAASVSKRAPAKKAAPATAKMSKADLEAQIVKLERALARSRKQVAELKLMVSDAGARADQAEIDERAREPVAKISKGKPVKQKPVTARGRRKKAEPVDQTKQDEPVLDEAAGESETEAHAS